jgi:hypothetical protein
MQDAVPRNLRTAERFLLVPPLPASFGKAAVSLCDISAKGARFRHAQPIETGSKALLTMTVEGRRGPVSLEAVVVWTHADGSAPGRFVSGVRTWGEAEAMNALLAQLHASHRCARIEEMRSTDRFYIPDPLPARFGQAEVRIEDLSARGARISTKQEIVRGTVAPLLFGVPGSPEEVQVAAQIVWCAMKSITGGGRSYQAGLFVNEKPELMRLAIGHLCELNRALLDTRSLSLKLKVLRARARQLAPAYRGLESSGIPAEQYLLIQGVREELRLNPEEALHWYRRARFCINDPATRALAPPIADHPDALAVWEYLDRSVDPTIVGRAFEL